MYLSVAVLNSIYYIHNITSQLSCIILFIYIGSSYCNTQSGESRIVMIVKEMAEWGIWAGPSIATASDKTRGGGVRVGVHPTRHVTASHAARMFPSALDATKLSLTELSQ